MEKFHFYKGKSTSTPFEFEPTTTLEECRQQLIGDGFLKTESDEETDEARWRFVNYQNRKPVYEDTIIGTAAEDFAPLSKINGTNNQIYLTNVNKKNHPDLVGFETDQFFDRRLSLKVELNDEERAKEANKGKFQPFMLTNVKSTVKKLGLPGLSNVVICEEDSLIGFTVASWAAAGFGFEIKPDRGEPIVGEPALYKTFATCPLEGNYSRVWLPYYWSNKPNVNKSMIKVKPISKMNIAGRSVGYMKFTVRSWIITEVKWEGTTHSCNLSIPSASSVKARGVAATGGTPYSKLANANSGAIVSGDSITPASTVPDTKKSSNTTNGSVTIVKSDRSPTGYIGEITFYLFAFKSHEEAKGVIEGINDIDPNVWN